MCAHTYNDKHRLEQRIGETRIGLARSSFVRLTCCRDTGLTDTMPENAPRPCVPPLFMFYLINFTLSNVFIIRESYDYHGQKDR